MKASEGLKGTDLFYKSPSTINKSVPIMFFDIKNFFMFPAFDAPFFTSGTFGPLRVGPLTCLNIHF